MSTIWFPHVTVAAILHQADRFLMVEEVIKGQTWFNQPAGHLEDGETLIQAIIREVQEETACQFSPEALTGIYQWRHPDTHTTFLRFCFTGEVLSHNPEQILDHPIIQTHWLNQDEIRLRHTQHRSPLVMKCVDDYLAGQRLPLELVQNLQDYS